MSWSNFEELKKFARRGGNGKKKRLHIGKQCLTVSKRRRTDSGSLSFLSITDRGEIEGFSSDEERENDLLESDPDDAPRQNAPSKPFVKRKYSKRQMVPDKRPSSSADCRISRGIVHKRIDNCKSCDFRDGACELQYPDVPKKEGGEIDWYASDEEELPQVFSEGSESDGAGTNVLPKHPGLKSTRPGNAAAKATNSESNECGEMINDFQSDQESSQECLSADISTPTPSPTPVSLSVIGTPKTASEWLKQIQRRSPQKNEDNKSPEKRTAGMSPCDSAKKKSGKFIRSGLAEQLHFIISREKSEKAFWNHRGMDKDIESAGAACPSDRSVTIQILFDQLQSSLHLTLCCVLCKDRDIMRDPLHQRQVFVLFTCETWKHLGLQAGATVKIYPPWQKLDISGVPSPVLLCTYFCEKQPTDQSPAVDLLSITGHRFLIPPSGRAVSTSTSLQQSPKKEFQPSRLLFGISEDACRTQNEICLVNNTVAPIAPDNPPSRPRMSILAAIESCGGCSGALVTFQCLVQRIYRKRIALAMDSMVNGRCRQPLYHDLKSAAKAVHEVPKEGLRWTLLVQDIHGVFAEIQLPPNFEYLPEWRSCIQQGEGKVFRFSSVRVLQKVNNVRSPRLFSVIQSLWPSRNNATANLSGTGQVLTQESGNQISNSSCPPKFCYILTVEESSQARLCQDSDVKNAGWCYKPCTLKTLCDVLHEEKGSSERVSALCKLIYCRVDGLNSEEKSFELFVSDSSLVSALKRGTTDRQFGYVRIMGSSCHVLPQAVKHASENFGTILCAKHLLLKANQELVADTYSVIRKALPESTSDLSLDAEHTSQDAMESLLSLKPAAFPLLTLTSGHRGHIYQVQGVVIGVDEDSACCWVVCGKCGNADITCKQGTSPQLFCPSCNVAVNSPKTKTHLEVFVKVKSLPHANVKVALQQCTIDKLLPVSYQDSDQGYDIEAVLGKQLDHMTCYVTERSEHDGTSIDFCLEEIAAESL